MGRGKRTAAEAQASSLDEEEALDSEEDEDEVQETYEGSEDDEENGDDDDDDDDEEEEEHEDSDVEKESGQQEADNTGTDEEEEEGEEEDGEGEEEDEEEEEAETAEAHLTTSMEEGADHEEEEGTAETQESDDPGDKLTDLQRAMLACLDVIYGSKDEDGRPRCELFRDLPDAALYPDYYQLIQHPICLSDIQDNIHKGFYDDLMAFSQDVDTMFDNAQVYNQEGSQIYIDAEEMQSAFEQELNAQIEKLPRTGGMAATARQVNASMTLPPQKKRAKRGRGRPPSTTTARGQQARKMKAAPTPAARAASSKRKGSASQRRGRKKAGQAAGGGAGGQAEDGPGALEPCGMFGPLVKALKKQKLPDTQRLCKLLVDMDRYRMDPAGFLRKWGFSPEPFKSIEHARKVLKLPNRPFRQNISVRAVSKSDYPEAAVQVLRLAKRRPLHYKTITQRAMDYGFLGIVSNNVHVTMNSQLNRCLDFYNAGNGYFGLMEWRDDQGRVPGLPSCVKRPNQMTRSERAKAKELDQGSNDNDDEEREPIQISQAEIDAFVVLSAAAKAGMDVGQVAAQLEARMRAFDVGLIEYRTEAARYMAEQYAKRVQDKKEANDPDRLAEELVQDLLEEAEFQRHRGVIEALLAGKQPEEIGREGEEGEGEGEEEEADGHDKVRGEGGEEREPRDGENTNEAERAHEQGDADDAHATPGTEEHGSEDVSGGAMGEEDRRQAQQQEQSEGAEESKDGEGKVKGRRTDVNRPFGTHQNGDAYKMEGSALDPATIRGTQRKVKRWRGTEAWEEHWKTHDRPSMGALHKTFHLGVGASAQGRHATGFPWLQVAMGHANARS